MILRMTECARAAGTPTEPALRIIDPEAAAADCVPLPPIVLYDDLNGFGFEDETPALPAAPP